MYRLILGVTAALIVVAICKAQAPAFEAASVRSSQPGVTGRSLTQSPGARLTTSNASVKMLIMLAWQVMPYQISGGPNWLESDGFDIDAKPADSGATQQQFRQMIQSLLADRFQLKIHRATEERSIYALVLANSGAKSGTKLVEAKNDDPEVSMRIEGPGRMTAVKATMAMFAGGLSKPLQRQVIDETGLKGAYSFKLQFAPEQDTTSDGPSIFTALEEQLGLSLKATKGPVEVLVIDHAERPGPN